MPSHYVPDRERIINYLRLRVTTIVTHKKMPPTLKNIPSHLIAHHVAPHLSTHEAARLNAAVPGLHHELGHAMKTIHDDPMHRSRAHLGKAASSIADRIIEALERTSTRRPGEITIVEGRVRIVVRNGWQVTFTDVTTRETVGEMSFIPKHFEDKRYQISGRLVVFVHDHQKLTVPEKARRGFLTGICKEILKKKYGKPVEMFEPWTIRDVDDKIRRIIDSGKSPMAVFSNPFEPPPS